MQLVFLAGLRGRGHSLGDGSRWYGVTPALPASRLSARHNPALGRGGEVEGWGRVCPRGASGSSPGPEAAAARSELKLAAS